MQKTKNRIISFLLLIVLLIGIFLMNELKVYADTNDSSSSEQNMDDVYSDDHEHTYDETQPSWQWSEDHWSCTAIFTCSNCDEMEYVACDIDADYIKDPTCTEDGEATFYATCYFQDNEYSTSEVWGLEAWGHDFSDRWIVDVLSTRTQEGSKARYCNADGCKEKTDITSIPKLESEIAATGEYEGMLWSIDENGVLTLSGEGEMPEFRYNTSEEFQEEIYVPWYEYRYVITAGIIEDGLTTIAGNVFSEHRNMKRIRIPEDVKAIGSSAFLDCNSLESIHIPKNVTTISTCMLMNCSSLKEIVLSDKVELIQGSAFSGCNSLVNINIPDGIKMIPESCFNECISLKEIEVPDSVTYIDTAAFAGCTNLHKVNIPKGVTRLEMAIFTQCTSLTNIEIPDGVTYIGEYAFDGCTGLENLEIPASVTEIAFRAFAEVRMVHNESTAEGAPWGAYGLHNYATENCAICKTGDYAHKHVYEEEQIAAMTFVWSDDYESCDVHIDCKECEQEQEIPCGVLFDITEPTCTTKGKTIYIAVITINGTGYKSSISKEVPALPHQYGNPVFDWDDCDVCLATFTCSGCNTEILKKCSITTETKRQTEDDCLFVYTHTAAVTFEDVIYTNVNQHTLRDHTYDEENKWHIVKYPTPAEAGSAYKVCIYCGEKEYATLAKLERPSFAGASLTLHDNLSIAFKAEAGQFAKGCFEEPYAVFEINGVKTKVEDYTVSDNKYVFVCDNIAPQMMNDTIKATLYGTFDDELYASETKEYSVASYCYSMLEKCTSDDYAKFRTLLVDLLIYGSKSQIYMNHRTDALVDAGLTEMQRSWGTAGNRTLESILDQNYVTADNPTAFWKGAGLVLQNAIGMRFKLTTSDSLEGLIVKVESAMGTWEIPSSQFEETTGGYYVHVNGIGVAHMSDPVYVTIYKDGEPISDTLRYSVESYAASKQNSENKALAELVKAMMNYGDSAKAYQE